MLFFFIYSLFFFFVYVLFVGLFLGLCVLLVGVLFVLVVFWGGFPLKFVGWFLYYLVFVVLNVFLVY